MRCKSKAQRCSPDLNPDMASGITCPPPEQKQRVVFLKRASSAQLIPVDFMEHLHEAAVTQDALGILTDSQTPGLLLLHIARSSL